MILPQCWPRNILSGIMRTIHHEIPLADELRESPDLEICECQVRVSNAKILSRLPWLHLFDSADDVSSIHGKVVDLNLKLVDVYSKSVCTTI